MRLPKSREIFVSYDKRRRITAVSTISFKVNGEDTIAIISDKTPQELVGQRVPVGENEVSKATSDLRIAIICNWHTKCGISTYSGYLTDALRSKVKEIRIFSEEAITKTAEDDGTVERCWKRGECLVPMAEKVIAWQPDLILIQHEFGIFPNAFYFMQMMQKFENIPYLVTLHSVYEHLDKIVYSACIKNMVVHTTQGRDILRKHGNTNNIFVVPHGCINFGPVQELWNICLNPYTIIQFGFGFAYKGVDKALEAIHYLKNTDDKFKNIFYTYLISDNDYNGRLHMEYYQSLLDKVDALGLKENVAIIRKFQTDEMLNLYLRLAKLAIFPYLNNPNNTVYAASGAIRVAMANNVPVIASDAHLFDDLEGIIARPANHIELAREIDRIFSDDRYKELLKERARNLIRENTWASVADKYLGFFDKIVTN